jgi:hypothetical protein
MSMLDKFVPLASSDGMSGPAGHTWTTGMLVEAADASLDEACKIIANCDVSACPPDVRQAMNLVMAAGVVMDGIVDHMQLPDPDGATGYSNWGESSALDVRAIALAGGDPPPWASSGGFADPGYLGDGKKRCPLDSPDHIRMSNSYVNQGANAAKYSAKQLTAMKAAIAAAAKKAGISLGSDADSKKVAASYVLLAASGEMASAHHEAFHGTHVHAHTHMGDKSHGPFDHGEMPAGTHVCSNGDCCS